mmetsp:Transcript_18966/g.45737  ORF Transcript_18966/g.45737 Transcript_18966/m.45737 type:complete len:86 (+) Transcript_18966:573-830(+)
MTHSPMWSCPNSEPPGQPAIKRFDIHSCVVGVFSVRQSLDQSVDETDTDKDSREKEEQRQRQTGRLEAGRRDTWCQSEFSSFCGQ